MSTIETSAHRSKIDIILTVAGTTGIVALFLPFHHYFIGPYTPIKALWDRNAWVLAASFFLAVPICLAWAMQIMNRRFSRTSRAMLYALGTGSAAATLSWFSDSLMYDYLHRAEIRLTAVAAAFGAGLVLWIRDARSTMPYALRPVRIMQVAYIANAALCLMAAADGWSIGAYFVLAATVVYTVQLFRALRTHPDVGNAEIVAPLNAFSRESSTSQGSLGHKWI